MSAYRKMNWKESPTHMRFLAKFKNPRSRMRESQYDYAQQELKENVDQAIQRLIDEEMLVEPTLAQAINAIHNKPPIEEMLRQNDLKVSGTKQQIIGRLIENAPDAARALVGEHDLLVCSSRAVELLDEYEEKRQQSEDEAKTSAFNKLLDGNGKAAYKLYTDYEKKYGHGEYVGAYHYYAEQIEIILNNDPKLLDHLNDRDRRHLRAAVCLPLLWRAESAVNWLPDDFSTKFADAEIICNLLAKYAEIKARVGEADPEDKFEITFDKYDVESCDLCRELDGKILSLSEMPELPYTECSSRKGCQCNIRRHWESRYSTSDDEFTTGVSLSIDYSDILDFDALQDVIVEHVEKYIQEEVAITLDPYSKLKQLKQMLDDDLISQDEYEQTKTRILSSM